MVLYAAIVMVLLALIFAPQAWVRREMARHAAPRPDLPGTGGELARHLLDRFALDAVRVERTSSGDHYDPSARTVRLSDANHDGRSITAVAVAAHEVAHALQHARGETLFAMRTMLARLLVVVDRIALVVLLTAPIVAALGGGGVALLAQLGLGIAFLGMGLIVHLATLPLELDASFGKALPILSTQGYLDANDLPAARGVLRAAAFTYVAGALIGLLNFLRILRVIR